MGGGGGGGSLQAQISQPVASRAKPNSQKSRQASGAQVTPVRQVPQHMDGGQGAPGRQSGAAQMGIE